MFKVQERCPVSLSLSIYNSSTSKGMLHFYLPGYMHLNFQRIHVGKDLCSYSLKCAIFKGKILYQERFMYII